LHRHHHKNNHRCNHNQNHNHNNHNHNNHNHNHSYSSSQRLHHSFSPSHTTTKQQKRSHNNHFVDEHHHEQDRSLSFNALNNSSSNNNNIDATTTSLSLDALHTMTQQQSYIINATSSDDDSFSDASSMDHDDDGMYSSCSLCHNDMDSKKRVSRRHMKIALQEESHVRIIRCVTLSFIVFSSIMVSVLVYKFAREYDVREFETKYEAHVESIENDFTWETKYNLALMKQLGSTITSSILATEQSPPFVTLPRFEVLGNFADGLGNNLKMTSFIPLVQNYQKESWEAYSVHHQSWLSESAKLRETTRIDYLMPRNGTHQDSTTNMDSELSVGDEITIDGIPESIWKWEQGKRVPLDKSLRDDQLLAPLWQTTPYDPSTINVDLLSTPGFERLYQSMVDTHYETVMSAGAPIGDLFRWMLDPAGEESTKREPHACILEPLFANATSKHEAVASSKTKPMALALGLTSLRHLFENILPENGGSVYAVLKGSDACGTTLPYLIDGPAAIFVGYHDLQDDAMTDIYQTMVDLDLEQYEVVVPLNLYETANDEKICIQTLHLYPSPSLKQTHSTNRAMVWTSVVAMAFLVTSFCFLIYERLVTKRENTKNAALQVVASLFPKGVQDEVLRGVQEGHHGTPDKGKVIASFFPATTILFADIAGFTAWSSTREPEQVFRLLETVYGAMDQIAIRRGIFKVETVGDCYVAVCGLPEPREDHAVAMTRFARDCQLRMASLSRQLEIALGPDTADLSFRIGMHSGPVTGGVLRGQNARFQLFGDTMNQASRMESTGVKDRIQMSTTTAKLLMNSGKAKWIEKRREKVDVKGKGLQETYFLKEESGSAKTKSITSKSSHGDNDLFVERQPQQSSRRPKRPSIESIEPVYKESYEQKMINKTKRLVTWNTEVLMRRVRSIVHQRERGHVSATLDTSHNTTHVEVMPKVVDQLQRHVQHIASMYRNHPFHNYEHASHVTLSMEKMLSNVKVKAADSFHGSSDNMNNISGEFTLGSLNGYTNDLTNDPLAQFAVVYSALIHDVDHPGCSNAQLLKDKDELALKYNGKSPAENHSIDLAWSTLMLPDYKELVDCLCPTIEDLERLKQLVTDAVLATDIFDVDLIENRNTRWQQVFGGPIDDPENLDKLRVMIVLDHLIQASDVAHTMQHWHVYIKWNERLFREMSDACANGKLAKDPAEFWYEGELGFFDKYVIPLAKKLRECGVFGVSCYEFLNYAETNRNEWETKGRDMVQEFSRRYHIERVNDDNQKQRVRSSRTRSRSIDACATARRSAPTRTLSMPLATEVPKANNNPAA